MKLNKNKLVIFWKIKIKILYIYINIIKLEKKENDCNG